ncbi:MAG TPA: hypothetical protein VMV81_13215 [Phycisphaerae bacterium]|nr:hypothetical protein [Phycisphaerae bacterium]
MEDIGLQTADTGLPPNPGRDEQLFCPICNYNLTGITVGRCPECGSLFDRQALIETQKSHAVILMPWDDPVKTSFRDRLLATLPICLFDARRFAGAFGVQRHDTRAGGFFLLTLIGVITCGCGLLWITHSGDRTDVGNASFSIFCVTYLLIATVLSTILFAVILSLSCPHFDGRKHFGPWWAISAYSSAHYLFVWVAVPLLPLALLLRNFFGATGFIMLFVLIFHVGGGLLAAFTLRGTIQYRTARDRRTVWAPGLLLAVALLSPVLVGFASGAFVAWLHDLSLI